MSISVATGALAAAAKPTIVNGALEKLGKLAVSQIGYRALSETQNEALHPLALTAFKLGQGLTSSSIGALTDKAKEVLPGGGDLAQQRSPEVSFGGFALTTPISDLQTGPTCGLESMENTIQLMKGDVTGQLNKLADEMQKKIAASPTRWDAIEVVDDDGTGVKQRYWLIPPASYPAMLKEYGVSAKLKRFSHETLQQAMAENRPVIVWGNVKYLEQYRGKEGLHAFVVTDWNPETGKYTILDSNSRKPYDVDAELLKNFATVGIPAKLENLFTGRMCVCQDSARWPWKTYNDRLSSLSKRGKDLSFGGLGASDMMHINGTSMIADGNKLIASGKKAEGMDKIRDGKRLIAKANAMKAGAGARG